jgi:hypothetical protein
MNTFATLLLAFPFYLAIKGKLANYISLAKPDASSSAASSQSSTNALPTLSGVNTSGANTSAPTNAGSNSVAAANTANTVTGIFSDVAAAASLS